jgi:hypothetical protein
MEGNFLTHIVLGEMAGAYRYHKQLNVTLENDETRIRRRGEGRQSGTVAGA